MNVVLNDVEDWRLTIDFDFQKKKNMGNFAVNHRWTLNRSNAVGAMQP